MIIPTPCTQQQETAYNTAGDCVSLCQAGFDLLLRRAR